MSPAADLPEVFAPTPVAIALNAVLSVVEADQPKALCLKRGDSAISLPYGPFDPARHRTLELGVCEWVSRQTQVTLGHIEQLYTFGDKGREAPAAALGEPGGRVVSVGYLALAPEPAAVDARDAQWRDWYGFFPWEDWRGGAPASITAIHDALLDWVAQPGAGAARARRFRLAFGVEKDGGEGVWVEERTLERYELMYEAGLIEEAWRDRAEAGLAPPPAGYEGLLPLTGAPMASDHRRILATAIGRLRGKLKYRPILFEMTPPKFTLYQLQRMAEAIVGFEFHKQNFRRSVEKSGFLERTGEETQASGGRPAALFRVDRQGLRAHAAAGLAIPRKRRGDEDGAI